MKPIYLKLTAFGPYKNTEIIDFRELKNQKLYVISGNTGAGKTTIFDGICFALFGSASGSDRGESKFLRSDFADDDTRTSAELLFELDGKQYRILRQIGHVKQGNKSKTGERYEFFEVVGDKEIPAVDRQMVSEIDKKIEALIGLSQDQFKQIVMLPQGEFRKLLTSETSNKEAILRRLFKTEKYNELNQIIHKKKQKADEAYVKVQQERDHYIHMIKGSLPQREGSELVQALAEEYVNTGQIISGLEAEIDHYREQISVDTKAYEKAFAQHGTKQKALYRAEQLNNKFKESAEKRTVLEQLQDQSEFYKALEATLVAAEKAADIEWQEKQALQLKQELAEKAKQSDKADQAFQLANEQCVQAEEQALKEDQKADERNAVRRSLEQLQQYLPAVKELDSYSNKAKNAKKQEDDMVRMLVQEKHKLKEASLQLTRLQAEVKELDLIAGTRHEKYEQLMTMKRHVDLLQDYLQTEQQQKALELEMKNEKNRYEFAKSAYENVENAWLGSQASMLAAHLHDGEACPVCGSEEHPKIAVHSDEQVSKEVLEQSKQQLGQNETAYRTIKVKVEQLEARLKELTVNLRKEGLEAEQAQKICEQMIAEGGKLKGEYKQIKAKCEQLDQQKQVLEKALGNHKKQEFTCAELERKCYEQKAASERAQAIYEAELKRIPEESRDLASLQQRIIETEKMSQQLEQAYEFARKQLEVAKTNFAKQSSEKKNAEKNVKEAVEKSNQAEKQFTASLKEKGFESEAEFSNAKLPSSEREKQKARLKEYHQKIDVFSAQVVELEKELEGKEPQQLELMQEELIALKQAYESALKKLNISRSAMDSSEQFKQQITSSSQKAMIQEKKSAAMADLYDVIRGQNSKKISLERYLQIEYLEQIIEAANERLKELSSGQFYLMRSDRQESHGKQSGLGLDVHDAYTGQTRDVKTLSGGEKFNASLCLALGMSDVIQSFQGNVSIDTMFIDEGFGSLDEESLHKAIDALIDLQKSGRTIGVISHVQELKAIFPAILEVKKTKEGYSTTKFVLK